MSDGKKEDFIEQRGVLFGVVIYVILWYILDYFMKWIFERYQIVNPLVKATMLFIVLLILIAIAYCRHYKIFPFFFLVATK